VTDKDHDQTSDEVTGETTSAFPSADFLNEPDALPTWAPTARSPVEGLPPGSALIVVERGPNAGSRFLLDQPVTLVGRHPGSDIFLDDVTVSRRHAEFRWEKDELHIVDVGSLNGTYVNREAVDSAVLVNGDGVQIGKFRLTFLTKPKNHGGAGGTHDSGSTDRSRSHLQVVGHSPHRQRLFYEFGVPPRYSDKRFRPCAASASEPQR
jgi:hypothetical protein